MKCSHDVCIRIREKGSIFCKYCIMLPAKECNYCEKR
jgi:hypothetical protein